VNKIFWLFIALFVFLIFRSWFALGEISAGDAGFYFPETLKGFPSFPYLWVGDGLGSYSSLLYYFSYLVLPLKLLAVLGLPWVLIERIVWYWPFLILGIFSSWFLVKTVLPEGKFRFLTLLIYLFNTYILMIVGGGQASIFLPYAIAPLVLGLFIQLTNYSTANYELRARKTVIAGLVLAIQLALEPRIAAITVAALIFYLFFEYRLAILKYLKIFLIPLSIVVGIHFYWILPTIILRKGSYDTILSSFGWVGFLSFANFSNSLSLLHPNWPQNIFGKTYLMRPEFLVLPILAFIGLLFVNELKNPRIKKIILGFSLLGLIGAFLAKGANPPLGEIYLWLFSNLPGMNLFRDASKFYILVALSYSILIPFSISEIYKRLGPLSKIFLLLVISYLLFLVRPAVFGQLGGTFKTKTVSLDYLQLKDFLNSQDEFFRTFWIPKQQRFGFYANNHPAISAENFLTDTVCLKPFCPLKVAMPEKWGQKCFPNDHCYVRELSYFLNPQTAAILAQMAVKYIIVPFDSEKEIFIAEHQYNHQQREEVEEFLDTISWLKKIDVAEKIAVYELPESKDHFFGIGEEMAEVQWQMINPTKYKVQVKNISRPFKLVFSETYDKLWQTKLEGGTISSQPYMSVLNSFLINKTGDFEVMVELAGQKYVYWGGVVSLATLLLSLGGLIYFRPRKTRQR